MEVNLGRASGLERIQSARRRESRPDQKETNASQGEQMQSMVKSYLSFAKIFFWLLTIVFKAL